MKTIRSSPILLIVVAGLWLTVLGTAATGEPEPRTLNVRWDKHDYTYVGLGILPDASQNTTWNFVLNSAADQSSLVYSDGTPATGIGFSIVGRPQDNVGVDHMGPGDTLRGGMIHTRPTARWNCYTVDMTFTGLDVDTAYRVALMGVRANDGVDVRTAFTAGGVTMLSGPNGPEPGNDFNAQNWVVFDALTTDGTGALQYSFTHGADGKYNQGYHNAIQIQEIIEEPPAPDGLSIVVR